MSGVVLGIDIGACGAIAWLDEAGELIAVYDMPILADGPSGRRAVNAPLLADIVAKSHATKAFVEFVGARPGEGAVGAFAFGRSRGSHRRRSRGIGDFGYYPSVRIVEAACRTPCGPGRGKRRC